MIKESTGADMTLALRPQPLGVFAMPANLLVLPASASQCADEALRALLRGEDPPDWPDTWRFYAHALRGDADAAHAALADDDSAIGAYNRFVLRADADAHAALARALSGELGSLFGVAAYAMGYADAPPGAGSLDGELCALALMSLSSYEIEHAAPQRAIAHLQDAVAATRVASPVFAAQLLAQVAELRRRVPGQMPALAIRDYQDALRLAGSTPLHGLRAELWMNLGLTYHELADGQRGALLEAVKAYQEALACGLSIDDMPELYAQAHNNLALAYLAVPMTEASDQLRMAVAVQSLREALKVYRRDAYPEQWASAQLNLANALQYLPSSHPQDNLVQAVNLYEELLAVRNKAYDPVGYARLLSNQANALAHLGMFSPALEKLSEAHKLFHWHGEPEAAKGALELVEQISLAVEARGEDERRMVEGGRLAADH